MRSLRDRLAASLTALALFAGGIAAFALPAHAQQLTVVRLGATPDDDLTSVLWAEKSGLFRKAGIDVQLTKMRRGAYGAVSPKFLKSGWFTTKASLIQPMIDASVKYGIISRGFAAAELVDPVALGK